MTWLHKTSVAHATIEALVPKGFLVAAVIVVFFVVFFWAFFLSSTAGLRPSFGPSASSNCFFVDIFALNPLESINLQLFIKLPIEYIGIYDFRRFYPILLYITFLVKLNIAGTIRELLHAIVIQLNLIISDYFQKDSWRYVDWPIWDWFGLIDLRHKDYLKNLLIFILFQNIIFNKRIYWYIQWITSSDGL